MSRHRHRQHVGRKAARVVSHPADEAQPRRRVPRGRLVPRDDHALPGISADHAPAPHAEGQEPDEARQRDEHAAVVDQQPPETLAPAGFRHDSLRKAENDREPFVGRQRRGQAPARPPRLGQVGRVGPVLRALRSGIALGTHLPDRHRSGEADGNAALVDREDPAGADRVPVELVVAREEAELARRAIAQRERVLGGHLQEVVVAGVDPDAVGHGLGKVRLRLAIAPHVQQLEPDDDPVAVSILVAGREVAIDAAADPAPLGPHGDLLGHVQAAVGLDLDGDVVGADALLGRRRERRQHARPPQQETTDDAAADRERPVSHRESSTGTA